MTVDTLRTLETPEGVALAVRVASPYPRAAAWLVDLALRVCVYLVLALATGWLGGRLQLGLMLIAAFLLEWFWSIGAEVWFGGASPGKRLVGLRVVRTDGLPVGLTESLLRNLLRAADFLPIGYGVGLVASLCSPNFQRLGDLLAGTMVIHVDVPPKRRRAATTPPIAPALPLRSHELAAITDFADRANLLTPERAIELAERLELITGAHGAEGVQRLRGIAAWAEGDA